MTLIIDERNHDYCDYLPRLSVAQGSLYITLHGEHVELAKSPWYRQFSDTDLWAILAAIKTRGIPKELGVILYERSLLPPICRYLEHCYHTDNKDDYHSLVFKVVEIYRPMLLNAVRMDIKRNAPIWKAYLAGRWRRNFTADLYRNNKEL